MLFLAWSTEATLKTFTRQDILMLPIGISVSPFNTWQAAIFLESCTYTRHKSDSSQLSYDTELRALLQIQNTENTKVEEQKLSILEQRDNGNNVIHWVTILLLTNSVLAYITNILITPFDFVLSALILVS